MQAPESFIRSLDYQFGGKFRIRWSDRRQRFQIEQKLAADACRPMPPMGDDAQHNYTDDVVRFHDGYAYFAEIAPGTLTPCGNDISDEAGRKTCQQNLKIPYARVFGMLTCPACDAHHSVAHWPLDDSLIEHIRSTDPERNTGLQNPSRSRYEAERTRQLKRAALRDDMAHDGADLARLDIPKVGYTGREQHAPEPASRVRFHKVYK